MYIYLKLRVLFPGCLCREIIQSNLRSSGKNKNKILKTKQPFKPITTTVANYIAIIFQCGSNGFDGIDGLGIRRFEREHVLRYGCFVHENDTHERARSI